MNRDELDRVLMEHKRWLESYGLEGKRADLSNANLSHTDLSHANLTNADLWGANLTNANLWGANLSGANLSNANLSSADLSNANLSSADLVVANLSYADLSDADLSRANLSGANLSDADLSDADILSANLSGANLSGANLSHANLSGADSSRANLSGAYLSGAYLSGANLNNVDWSEITAFFDLQCPEEGSFVAYKKCRDNAIVKLLIPEDAKRSSSTSRKCRCDKAIVIEIVDSNGNQVETAVSNHDGDFIYEVGKTVKVDNFDEDRWRECSTGIHFFITRAEAENY